MLELPFWISLLIWSLVPSVRTPWVEIESIPVSSKDILLVAVTCFYLLLPASDRVSTASTKAWRWHKHLPILTSIMLLYAAVSVQGSDLDARNTPAMIYTLLMSASGFLLGYNLIVKRSVESVRLFLWRLTVGLAAIGLVYLSASFFSLGIGDVREGFDSTLSDFGIVRVAGPLFISSTGHFILLPALAFSIQEALLSRSKRSFNLIIVLILTLTFIGLGSRAGLLIFGLFFLFLSLIIKDKKQARNAIVLMIIVVLTAAGLVFSKVNIERLQSFEDVGRVETHLTSFEIIEHRTAELNFFGSGYGSYWSWYLTDVEGEDVEFSKQTPVTSNNFGLLLYHPHSTFLLFIVELGMIGLLYFLYLWVVLAQVLLRTIRSGAFPIFTCGVVASAFSMFFDFLIFKGPQINALWWTFLFGVLALNSGVSQCPPTDTSHTAVNKYF